MMRQMTSSATDDLEAMATFAPRFVLSRMEGFEKDVGICLTAIPHPILPKTSVAYFPVLGLCCATLDYLASLFGGSTKNGPHIRLIDAYAQQYLPRPDYNHDVIQVLFNSLRHSNADQGIAKRVWVEIHNGRQGRRIAWQISVSNRRPAIQILEKAGEVSLAPWPCPYTHRTHVQLGRLWRDIRASAIAYADDISSSPVLIQNFTKCMKVLYPKLSGSTR
jgi:hypothetical protein